MKAGKLILIGLIASFLSGCHSTASDSTIPNNVVTTNRDTAMVTEKVLMIISSIPFPTDILDTLYSVHAVYESQLPVPVESASLYSQSNSESANLGVMGADLAYVISFEQFQQVGPYMKATKLLTDKMGVPMAFTQNVFERCQKNQNNKDSLTRIVFESYNMIDKTLKENKRNASEVLVLAGGWIESIYLTTQSYNTNITATAKLGIYHILVYQKKYLDKLLSMLDVINDSPYCQEVSNSLHDLRADFNSIGDDIAPNVDVVKSIGDKINALRTHIVKGGNS